MKKILASSLMLGFLALSLPLSAQFIVGVQGSYLTGAGENANGQAGIGVQGKAKISNRLAVGGIARTWFKNFSEVELGSSSTLRSANTTTQLAGMLEYYFGQNVQPYIGTDAGLYFTNTVVESGGNININSETQKTYFGVGPKAGIQFNWGFISPFVQAQYHFLFGGGEDIQIPGIGGTPIDLETYSQFWTFDLGILFQFGKAGGKK